MRSWRTARLSATPRARHGCDLRSIGVHRSRCDYVPRRSARGRGVNLARRVVPRCDFVYITEELASSMPRARLLPGDLVVHPRGSEGGSMVPRGAAMPATRVDEPGRQRLDPAKLWPSSTTTGSGLPRQTFDHARLIDCRTALTGRACRDGQSTQASCSVPRGAARDRGDARRAGRQDRVESPHERPYRRSRDQCLFQASYRSVSATRHPRQTVIQGSGLAGGRDEGSATELNLGNFTTTGQLKSRV